MPPVIIWVLVSLGHDPRPVQTFPERSQCVQAVQDYTPRRVKRGRDNKPLFACRQQVLTPVPHINY